MTYFFDKISENPIIASVKDLAYLNVALESPCEVIFLLTGNIFNLKEISSRVRSKNKGLYIHIESIDGFSKDTWGLEYIIRNIYPDGIITEKSNLVKLSRDMGMFTIQRVFIPDSKALENAISSIRANRPHAVEILPGIMPKIIAKFVLETNISVIASGLITDIDSMNSCLSAGAIAISSSNQNIWYF